MNDVFLLLGSNVGNRQSYMRQAIEEIDELIGRVIVQSQTYETAAWGKEEQPKFINIALRVYTSHDPKRLLRSIHTIEQKLDRIREEKWGPRSVDIDILLYNDQVILEDGLCIPHKLLHKRRFALTPLNDIAAKVIHPILNISIQKLLENCTDTLEVYPLLQQHG